MMKRAFIQAAVTFGLAVPYSVCSLARGNTADYFGVSGFPTPVPVVNWPTPGHHGEAFNYISPDGRMMLSMDWIWAGYPQLLRRTWDEQAQQFGNPTVEVPPDASAGYLSPDGNMLFYNSRDPYGIRRAYRTEQGWSPGQLIIPSPADFACFNGRSLFCADHLHGTLMVAAYDRSTSTFSAPELLDSLTDNPVNVPGAAELHPWVSLDGSLLLFLSDRPGGYGIVG